MDEIFDCWTVAKNPYDYHLYFNEWAKIDTRDMVRRDRNHPSIVLYSAGNEIRDTANNELATFFTGSTQRARSPRRCFGQMSATITMMDLLTCSTSSARTIGTENYWPPIGPSPTARF
jgi:beta-galactosidase/beta-glucuronidase